MTSYDSPEKRRNAWDASQAFHLYAGQSHQMSITPVNSPGLSMMVSAPAAMS